MCFGIYHASVLVNFLKIDQYNKFELGSFYYLSIHLFIYLYIYFKKLQHNTRCTT